jgi:hypothetical protein
MRQAHPARQTTAPRDMTALAVRRALVVTLIVDAANVASLFVVATSLAHDRDIQVAGGAAFGYGFALVGLAGVVLAAVAVLNLIFRYRAGNRSAAARMIGIVLVCAGLAINTLGCLALMAGNPPRAESALGMFLLVGGDFLSGVYLTLFACCRRR